MDKMDIENAETMRRVYDEFMRAGEQNDEGFPIREWSAVTRAEAENLMGLGLTTLEKLSAAPDDMLRTFTGGKELKQKAQGWLDDAKDKGIMASKYERLQKALEAKEDEVITLKKQIGALVEQVEALTKASLKPKEK
jgi:adenine-specific DNA methylase